jgi:cytochrome P450
MKSGGAVWDTAPDEIIRWATPAIYFRRTLTQDFEAYGNKMSEGDKVLFWFSSANRDEEVFEDAMRVDLMRTPNKHLAFGHSGPHLCLGMWLARLEVRIFFEEMAKRISSVEGAGVQKFVRSNFVGGIKSLPVRIKRL